MESLPLKEKTILLFIFKHFSKQEVGPDQVNSNDFSIPKLFLEHKDLELWEEVKTQKTEQLAARAI